MAGIMIGYADRLFQLRHGYLQHIYQIIVEIDNFGLQLLILGQQLFILFFLQQVCPFLFHCGGAGRTGKYDIVIIVAGKQADIGFGQLQGVFGVAAHDGRQTAAGFFFVGYHLNIVGS